MDEFNQDRGFFLEKKNKLIVFSLLVFFVVLVYVIKLFSMQVIHGESFRDRAERISQRTKRIVAQRGEIYDRNATVPMVLNIDSFAVDITLGEIPRDEINTVISKLAVLLGVKKEKIEELCTPEFYRSFTPIEVKSNVPYETIAKIAEKVTDLPGVSWKSKPVRSYVDTGSLSHIIGYVGDITKEELKIYYNKGYNNNSVIGKTGIEKQYEELLRGVDGSEARTVDVKGRNITGDFIVNPPVMGKNLVLTIDKDLQLLAEKALGERMGAIVVLKPSTGEVLAMVSYPFYDSNIFTREGWNLVYQKLLADSRAPLLNRAISSSYPPASTFKVIMTTGLLEEKAIDPFKEIECKGEMVYGDRLFRCHIRRPGHGFLNMEEALGVSCDIYYWVACRENLGIEKMIDYAEDFQYGKKTGIDLPNETEGFIPTPQWKERRFHEKWLGGDTLNMSIGQGYTLASPLQVADMCAMVVNSGVIYKPHILKEVRDPVTGEVIQKIEPEVLHKSDVSEETFKTVADYMHYVVTEGSSRYPMQSKIVKIAGKSGTAEVGLDDRWHSWFIAYAPYDGPAEDAIVVSTIVEASNPWEWWAPYATSIVIQGYFGNQTYDEAVDALGFRYLIKPTQRME
ncbi:MAG: penicillin-binding protein 2 [Spirochaetes bacterium]|uniref:Penicillin-binding protein 2 n=1 Tax=Candidatus Gallitreponema excrementavium TaxID=2840840 RepID=A0A9D9HRR0_9SPIR|nr:penicillin-binding protein 2 [Candidatus Gallitreponema excrementavium]